LIHPVETSLYDHIAWNVFRYLEPRSRGLRVWQTDRQTDRMAFITSNSIGRALKRFYHSHLLVFAASDEGIEDESCDGK